MSGVTLKVLHGADRGKVFHNLNPPFTVGREEINDIQLNDERVSRCHFKIQRDNDRLVLTDLDSTNGTKVNGVEYPLKILRSGDLISVGRSLMLVGSEEEIAARLAALGSDNPTMAREMSSSESSVALDLSQERSPFQIDVASLRDAPSIPDNLSPGQRAQLCEILDFLQHRICRLVDTAKIDENSQSVSLKLSAWQRLLSVQARLSEMHRKISDPEWNGEN
ncbi:FHA domain-containing protein [Roseiconus lacunae]|uniref:FHA domain-containing protein n=1 Tax=Roseiconus lacunae TaxID=2605694 RepID=A0ABT7PLS8_9BACT|nr:FHA domain-containing protein [Roseiconus lacunae]MCD0458091.1 FHA domain-containing protein [Roseiconus lacunae]MDM4017469.1 FHA domain-containing protein [Roseiconus lacunae]WRQ53718.1 FHA domain-containing protein [Stieleria sp. HD01]